MQTIGRILERALWRGRVIVVVAVIASAIIAVGVLYMATIDVVNLIARILQYGDPALDVLARESLRLSLISEVIKVLDVYLLASIMVIFALGLYELFIGKIGAAESSEFADRLLLIRSLDDLKHRLANVVLLILVIKFFQQALRLKYESPLDLLYLAIGILLIGGALSLSHRREAAHASGPASHVETES